MTYEAAMTEMKQGRVARREGWEGHVRIEGLRMIRVRPGALPSAFHATREDQAASDWVASQTPARSEIRTSCP